MNPVATALKAVHARLAGACAAAGRAPGSVRLLAVSKHQPLAALEAAIAAGQRAFGESQAQEALPKIQALGHISLSGEPLEWHFIGPVQRNKTRVIAEHFDWLHSLERADIAERLSGQRPPGLPPLQVCVQVNISGETSKHGVPPAQAGALCHAVAALPGVRLRGLMGIPAPTPDGARQREPFRVLSTLLAEINATGLMLDTLSMGMSDDLEAAIAEGSTWVRVGSAIFGGRT
jgi:hypothetical protein